MDKLYMNARCRDFLTYKEFEKLYDFMIAKKEFYTGLPWFLFRLKRQSDPKTALSLYHEHMRILESDEYRKIPSDKAKIELFKKRYKRDVDDLLSTHPELRTEKKITWKGSAKLFEVGEHSGIRIYSYALQPPFLYLLLIDSPTMTVLRINLNDRTMETIASMQTEPISVYVGRMSRTSIIANNLIFVPTHSDGILVFPLDGKEPYKINKSSGMPSDWVQNMAIYDDSLYVVVGGEILENEGEATYFIKCQLPKGEPKVISSSMQIQDNDTPFKQPLTILSILPDTGKKCLYLLACGNRSKNDGLWQYYPEDSSWKLLWHYPILSSGLMRWENDKVMISASNFCLLFTPATGKITAILSNGYVKSENKAPLEGIPNDGLGKCPPHIILDDALLFAGPFVKRKFHTTEIEYLPSPLSENYFSIMEKVDDERIVVGTIREIGLITIKGTKPPETGAEPGKAQAF